MKVLTNTSHAAPLAILSYCVASILMTVTNKLVLSSYDFKLNFLLLAIQSLVCVIMLEACSILGWLSHRPFRLPEAKNWFVVSLALVLMIYTGSKALQFLSIPVFTIFKNLTIILTAYAERYLLMGSPVTRLMLVSFFLIVVSSVVAGWADIAAGNTLNASANDVGVVVAYGWMVANCLTTSAFTLFMRSKLKSCNFKDFDAVFYNNLLSIPTLIFLSLVTEVPEALRLYDRYFGVTSAKYAEEFYGLSLGIIISSISSFGISYSTSWCVRVTSSTTYSMVGALNKLPIAIAGMVFFDAVVTTGSVSGVVFAFIGGIVYSYAKTVQNAANAPGSPRGSSAASASGSLPMYQKVSNASDDALDSSISVIEDKENHPHNH
ncbi:hypothetical protein BC831DRAFT_442902 [Entophlyctis helioformis]|nr:hypothetical protein BC831DRAFT_442902 [Entophlyctis helioformis]